MTELMIPGIGHNQPPPEELTKDYFERNFEPERAAHTVACPRVPVKNVIGILPAKYITSLETNEGLALCCRAPRDHDIEAFYSSDADRDRGVPDIYVFHCGCGRKHRRFCVGGSAGSGPNAPLERRPFWEIR
jgi:hypothetical protein